MGELKLEESPELLYERFRKAAPSFGFREDIFRREADFEALFELFRDGPPPKVLETLKRLMEVTNQVCEIRVRAGGRLGTGFLVGPDRVLTASHVIGSQALADLECVFNNIQFIAFGVHNGSATRASIVAELDRSELALGGAVTPTALDFILLRLDTAVGDATRQFIRLKETRVDLGDSISVVIFAESDAVTLATGVVTEVLTGLNDAAFLHGARTSSGASGAPVFNNRYDIVGLHRGGVAGSTNNEAIDISRIVKQLRDNGHL